MCWGAPTRVLRAHVRLGGCALDSGVRSTTTVTLPQRVRLYALHHSSLSILRVCPRPNDPTQASTHQQQEQQPEERRSGHNTEGKAAIVPRPGDAHPSHPRRSGRP